MLLSFAIGYSSQVLKENGELFWQFPRNTHTMNQSEGNQPRSLESPINEEHGLEQTHSLFKHLSNEPAIPRVPTAKTHLTRRQRSVADQEQTRGQYSQDVALFRQRNERVERRKRRISVPREAQSCRQQSEQEGAPDPNIAIPGSSFAYTAASSVSPVSLSNGLPLIREGLIRSDQDLNINLLGKDRVIANAEQLHARLEEIAPDCHASSTEEWTL